MLDTVAEKLTAVNHSNGVDYWILTHKYYSDAFYAFLLTSEGIVDTVESRVGSFHPKNGELLTAGAIGQMKASPNGEKIAVVSANMTPCHIEYYDFNSSTGVVSNHVDLSWLELNQYYGASFSPDNSKLYVTGIFNSPGIHQFDLNAGGGDPEADRNSRTLISESFYRYQGLQLGPDGKIYGSRSQFTSHNSNLVFTIHSPNLAGLNCNYQEYSIVYENALLSLSLPNFLDSFNYTNGIPDCTTTSQQDLQQPELSIFPNPVSHQATIVVPDDINSGAIEITNSLGQSVLSLYINGFNQVIFQRDNLPAGIYYLQLIDNNSRQYYGRFVVADY